MAQHGGQTVVSCQMCEQISQIKMKCLDCNYLLCANCCQLHTKVKLLSDHQLVELHNIGSIKEGGVDRINFRNIKCRSHADQKCCLFCEDCEKVVCVVCISEKHNKHKMIKLSEGHKLQIIKIATWRTDVKKKIKTLSENMSTLNAKYDTENSKYNTEMEKILNHDKVLKEAVDTQTKSFVIDLDQRWYSLNKSIKGEISHADKYKHRLQLREKQLEQVFESSDADDVFRTVEKEHTEKTGLDCGPINLEYETLPTFRTSEINLPAINSLYGSLLDNHTENTEIRVVECYQTDTVSLSSIKCNTDGTVWINHSMEEMLKCVEKHENQTLATTQKLERNIKNIALLPNKDLLLSVGESRLLMLSHKLQTITKTQFNVSSLVTTAAIHVSSHKIIMGAIDSGPLYPATGPRQIIMMDTKGAYQKVYELDDNGKPLFTHPRRVTADSRNNLYVLDRQSNSYNGRVVILNNQTGQNKVYNGHLKMNNRDHLFTPGDLVATKSDNIVVSDRQNHLLHILNSDGECTKYINTEEYGIKWPWSLDIDKGDLLHIGCFKKGTIKISTGLISGAKLYVVKFSDF